MRKTVKIVDLVDQINAQNAGSYCDPLIREGWNSLLETILRDADAYSGFGYLESKDLTDGAKDRQCAPGIISRSIEDGGTIFPDETRRCYYLKPGMR